MREQQQSAGFKITKDKTQLERNNQVHHLKAAKQHHFDMVIKKNLRKTGSGATLQNGSLTKPSESNFADKSFMDNNSINNVSVT